MLSIRHTSPLFRYGVAVLAVGVAFAIKVLLDPLIVQGTPFLLIFGAIMISAWYGGLGPGLLATVAAGLTTDYFFLQPTGSFSGFSLETVPLLVFYLEGTLVCLLTEALRAARVRAEGSKLEAERHRERLRRNEEHFRSLVEGMRDYAIFTLDPNGCVASWNAGAERLEGYNPEEIVGEHFSVFFAEEDTRLGKPEEHLEAAASEGRSVEENWLVREDGSRFWADTILTALHDDEGKLRGFSVVAQDITEKKEAERHLEEAEDRLRTLVEHVPAITYTGEVGGDHALDYVSPQIEEVLGYSPGEVMADPDHWTKKLHPHDRRWVLAEDRRTGETGDPFALEYRMFARNGRVVWLRDEATLVRDEEGNPLHWQGFMLDVTKRKKAEERLRESEELYRNVVEQAAENIFLMDPYTKHILQANASFHHSLGYEAEELRHLTLYDIVAHDQESVDLNIGRIMEEGHLSLGERQYRRKDGSLADVEVNASAVPYNGEKVMCVVAHDVTERKRAERMLEEIREAERNRLARELHDSTLQDIVYALQEVQVMQVVSGDDLNPALEDTAEALKRSVEGLRGAIFELRLKETLNRSLVFSLETLVDLNRRMARGRYEVELVVGDDFPARLPNKAGQELTRLVQEALTNVRRHAEASHVRVDLGLDGGLAYVEVSDDGCGFDSERTTTGIGRQSMRHRALELGGEFSVERAPGEGTRVRFSIPVTRLVKG